MVKIQEPPQNEGPKSHFGHSNPFAGNTGFQDAHNKSDVDSEPQAQHHTLGKGGNQAAPGSEIPRLEKLIVAQSALITSQAARITALEAITALTITTPTPPTVPANVKFDASAVRAIRRSGIVEVNISATCTTAAVSGDVIAILAAGYAPTTNTIFGDVINTTTGASLRVHVMLTGELQIQGAVAVGNLLRGQIIVPTS